MPDYEFVRLTPDELPMDRVAEAMRIWFHREPWLEVARCPSCSPEGNFGAAGRYPDFGEDGLCPVCGTPLEEYWSDTRVDQYFQDAIARDGAVIYGLRRDGEVVAWTWAYSTMTIPELADQGPHGIYVDTFGFTEGSQRVMEFFAEGHQEEQRRGAEFFIFRTHRDAQYVRDTTSPFGYNFFRFSHEEADREYHIYVPEPLA